MGEEEKKNVILLTIVVISILLCVGLKVFLRTWYQNLLIQRDYIQGTPTQRYVKNVFSKKILVYQTGSYKKMPEFVTLSKVINELYCQKWGYDFKFFSHDDCYPVYWLKTFELKKLMDEHPPSEYEIILYLDSDAVFYDFDTSIEELLSYVDPQERYTLLIGKDPPFFRALNAGAFIVRNTRRSKDIINRWCGLCVDENGNLTGNCSSWEKDKKKDGNGEWSCKMCIWAGRAYEQGSLENLFYEPDIRPQIGVLNDGFISNRDPGKVSFILHLMATSSAYREKIFTEYLNKLLRRGE